MMRRVIQRTRRAVVRSVLRTVLLSASSVVALSCRWVRSSDPTPFSPVRTFTSVNACGDRVCRDSMDIIALGVSGYLFMAWRDTTHVVLVPPGFRNPSIWRVFVGDVIAGTHPDTARIRRRLAQMPAASLARLARVRTILVGHGHYDHLLDLPAMAPLMTTSRVYGSETVVNLLWGASVFRDASGSHTRLVNVDAMVGQDAANPGEWIVPGSGPWAFKAVAWQHARNFPGVTYAKGDQRTPRDRLPRTARGWKMGPVLAWTLDLRDSAGGTSCRVLLQDAAASPMVVTRAAAIWNHEAPASATLAVITAANYDRVKDNPDALLTLLRPQHVLLAHWEEFFRSPEQPWRLVRGINGQALIDRVRAHVGDRWSALEPGAVLRLHC